ncbi:CaiB/BaiF CoA transferase family protein [Phytoactinopolyspora endophytica]|uniref:CaiB/BaiF CoA transferase family protein n=1 Tax=Phytoactinopolyspora endophytica TaxID=1642495 RepID=UPI0013EDF219|nr:CoA transferase [Phytoactinopolyspora endophytica]
MSKLPLEGLTILDCTSVVMGPYATSLLADLGADVIKIEPPGGDIGRAIGPRAADGLSALSLRLLRNKRSTVLDLSHAGDYRQFADLVARADAVVTNIRPSARDRLGLDYESLRALRGDIVLCTAQAFSSCSARRDVPAYDDTVQALSGMSDTYRLRDGEPAFAPSVIADKVCGILMALATLSALFARARDGEGQWVDVPMVDNMAAFNLVEHLAGFTFIPPDGDAGWPRSLSPHRRPHAARDGWACVMPYTDEDWRKFLVLAQRIDLVETDRFATAANRNEHDDEAQSVIAEFVAARSVREIITDCASIGVACAEVRTLESLLKDDYLASRGVIEEAVHPEAGPYQSVRLPFDFSRTPIGHRSPAPSLDTDRR